MSDKSPRQSMSKKSGKSIKEKRAEKRAKGHEETFSDKLDPTRRSDAPEARRRSARRRRRTSTGCPSTPSTSRAWTPTCGPGSRSSTGTATRFGVTDAALGRLRRRLRVARARSWRTPTSCCCPSRSTRTSPRCAPGQVLWGWPHCVQDPELTQLAIDRRADPDRVRGDEPLDPRRCASACTSSTRTTSWPATARCCTRWSWRASTGDYGRRLTRGRDRLRRHRAWRRDRAQRPRRPRGRGADQPRGRGGRLADPLGADPAVRPRPGRRRT